MAFAFGPTLSFPIVLTGAQAPPNVPYGDAATNLYRACQTALQDIPEVVVCFGEYVFRGCRAQKKDDRSFDGFHSPTYPILAHITEEIQVFKERLLEKNKAIDGPPSLRAGFSEDVLTIRQSPGLDPRYFLPLLEEEDLAKRKPVRGVVFQTLGAGNVPTEGWPSFLGFIQKAKARGIPVVITSQYAVHSATHTRYSPGLAPIECGAIPVGDMTSEAAETKLRWILHQVRDIEYPSPSDRVADVERRMLDPYVGELNQVSMPVRRRLRGDEQGSMLQ
jgi:L-asparaginase